MNGRIFNKRIFQALAIPALAVGLGLAGCRSADPPPEAETVLRLKLHDSLSRYERVLVEILELPGDGNVLNILWNSSLALPGSELPSYPLKQLAEKGFIVRIKGFSSGDQLALETRIIYEQGRKTVSYVYVPPLVPRNKLARILPSIGTMSPSFHSDSLDYLMTLPEGTESIRFALTAAFAGARITFDGDSVASGASTKPISVGLSPDSAFVRVTDVVEGKASTLTYKLLLQPTKPAKLSLASITPSVGALSPPFDPEIPAYYLLLPADADSVSFVLSAADVATMTVTFNGMVVFPGEKSKAIVLGPNSPPETAPITVIRGSDRGNYQVTVTRGPLP